MSCVLWEHTCRLGWACYDASSCPIVGVSIRWPLWCVSYVCFYIVYVHAWFPWEHACCPGRTCHDARFCLPIVGVSIRWPTHTSRMFVFTLCMYMSWFPLEARMSSGFCLSRRKFLFSYVDHTILCVSYVRVYALCTSRLDFYRLFARLSRVLYVGVTHYKQFTRFLSSVFIRWPQPSCVAYICFYILLCTARLNFIICVLPVCIRWPQFRVSYIWLYTLCTSRLDFIVCLHSFASVDQTIVCVSYVYCYNAIGSFVYICLVKTLCISQLDYFFNQTSTFCFYVLTTLSCVVSYVCFYTLCTFRLDFNRLSAFCFHMLTTLSCVASYVCFYTLCTSQLDFNRLCAFCFYMLTTLSCRVAYACFYTLCTA